MFAEPPCADALALAEPVPVPVAERFDPPEPVPVLPSEPFELRPAPLEPVFAFSPEPVLRFWLPVKFASAEDPVPVVSAEKFPFPLIRDEELVAVELEPDRPLVKLPDTLDEPDPDEEPCAETDPPEEFTDIPLSEPVLELPPMLVDCAYAVPSASPAAASATNPLLIESAFIPESPFFQSRPEMHRIFS